MVESVVSRSMTVFYAVIIFLISALFAVNNSKCSQDTALRDINDLLERNILRKGEASGRSTVYILNME